jgi:hypothetical protein
VANKLIPGIGTYLEDFATGQGSGATGYFNYASDEDINFLAIRNSVNALVDEMRGVQGNNAVLPLDIVTLDDPGGLGVTDDAVMGTASYLPAFISTTQVDVNAGIAVIARVRQAGDAVSLSPRLGTLDGATWWDYIAVDINGALSINTAPASQQLDLWRFEVNAGGTAFVDNFEKVGIWQYGIDGDAWAELSNSTGLGGVTFTNEQSAEPGIRVDRTERLLSGFVTDLQDTPATIGPVRLLPGTAATPGTILGDGAATSDTGTGIHRPGADRFGISTAGVARLELDATGNLDLPTNSRVKGRRTASQTIGGGGSLEDVVFTATDVFDVGAWHDPGGGSPEDFTVPTGGDGTYLITAAIEWAEAITNIRDVVAEIQLGDTLIPGGKASARLELGEDHASTITVVAVLAAANVITVQVSQDDTVGALGLDVIDATLTIVKVA